MRTTRHARETAHSAPPAASGERSLKRDFSWALTSNVIYYGCQWGLVIVLAKLGTPSDVGAYALGIAITAPILMLASFQARNLVASDISGEYNFSDYVTFRAASLSIALLVIGCVVAATQSSRTSVVVILLIGLAQASDVVSDTYFGLLQRHDRMDQVSISLMVKGPLSLILVGLGMWLTHSVVWAAAALLAGRCLTLLCLDIPHGCAAAGQHGVTWKWATQRRLFITALPLGVISGLGVLTLNMPRYFIEYGTGKAALGIFSALASIVGAGNLVIAALGSCSIVDLARAWVARDRGRYRQLSFRFIALSAVIGIAGVVIALIGGDKLLTLLFRADYAGNGGVLARIMIAGALGYIVSAQGYTMTAARKLLPQIPALVGSGLVSGVCCWFLVPRRGLIGAAESWIFGSLFLLICNSLLLTRIGADAKDDPEWKGDALAPALRNE